MPSPRPPLRSLFSVLAAFALLGCDPPKPNNATSISSPSDPTVVSPKLDWEQEEREESVKEDVQHPGPTAQNPKSSAGSKALRILAWNIESGGADPQVIASQLTEMPRYDVYGFTEVDRDEWPAIQESLGESYTYWYSHSGWKDRTAFAIRNHRLDRTKKYEMKTFQNTVLNPGKYRSPHVHELHDRETGVDFLLVLNHLARGDENVRQTQAKGLRQWAEAQTAPVIAIGDYNFDYVFSTGKGNRSFDIFTKGTVFQWVKPVPMIDSNWFDGDSDGKDDYPGSILDFCFVAGEAKSWNPHSRVIVREGDFPDDETTSDHRPVELIVTPSVP